MQNIVYKVNASGERMSLYNGVGFFQDGWLRIENISVEKGDFIQFCGEDLDIDDGIYEIIEANSGIYRVEKCKNEI